MHPADLTAARHDLERLMSVPPALRTDHWYNDLQHAMLIILFRHLLAAVREGADARVAGLTTLATLYLWVHFADEEEGMCWALARGLVAPDAARAHAAQHRVFLDRWRDRVLAPARSNQVADGTLYAAIADYYDRVLRHIEATDQETYGPATEAGGQTRSAIAHVAHCGLPLSPFMAGAVQVVEADDPAVAALLDRASIGPLALRPLSGVALQQGIGPLLPDGRGLRDRLARALPRRAALAA